MKTAILPRPALRTALAHVKNVVERRNTIPILSNLLIRSGADGVTVTGTDLDQTLTVTIPGAVGDDGLAVTLPAYALAEVEKKAPATDAVALDAMGESARLDFEGLQVSMQALDPSDWPDLPFTGDIHGDFTMATEDLARALSRTMASISTEATRYYLNGIYVHVLDRGNRRLLRFVSTDGHRMTVHEIDAPEGVTDGLGNVFAGFIIPLKAIDTILRVANAKGAADLARVVVNTSKIRVVIGNVDIVTKLIDGTFPDYARAIPASNDKRVLIDSQALYDGIKAVSCVQSERGRAVRLALEPGTLTLSTANPEMGSARLSLPCDYAGESTEIGFNSGYLLDVLDTLDSDRVTIALADPGSPALVTDPDNDSTFCVLMPMRV